MPNAKEVGSQRNVISVSEAGGTQKVRIIHPAPLWEGLVDNESEKRALADDGARRAAMEWVSSIEAGEVTVRTFSGR